jgi:hypothetical protein
MGNLIVKFLLFKGTIMFKSHLVKSNHRALAKLKVNNYGTPGYSDTGLAAKM